MQGKDEYQHTATIYDFLFSRALREIRLNIRAVLAHCHAQNVIDLCCGTGEQLRMLACDDILLTGVDLSQAMLAKARQASPDVIHYLEADAGRLPLPDSGHDGVIISFGLHEKTAPQHEAIFSEACRLLAPDGNIIIADYCTPPAEFVSLLIGRGLIPVIERTAGLNHYHNYRDWMAGGGIDGFLERNNPGKLSLISPHFNGCIKLYVVSKVKNDPLSNSLKRQLHDKEPSTQKGTTT
ncbi:MAG: class I SAM-dependent methyltransferase [Desulfocapsa sp.]|nr:class I SAM-dependent methyltransferase [Desulfocapsa sp.]